MPLFIALLPSSPSLPSSTTSFPPPTTFSTPGPELGGAPVARIRGPFNTIRPHRDADALCPKLELCRASKREVCEAESAREAPDRADAAVKWVAGHLVDFLVVSTPATLFAAATSGSGQGESSTRAGRVSFLAHLPHHHHLLSFLPHILPEPNLRPTPARSPPLRLLPMHRTSRRMEIIGMMDKEETRDKEKETREKKARCWGLVSVSAAGRRRYGRFQRFLRVYLFPSPSFFFRSFCP
ncbi:hypothetical protein C8R45DRAFT_1208650 [Mycena sanguinolenta]|nr:hypothetical protein C8R45DRAFT_1208650 [Mycena sanguinolenta]